MTGLNSRFFSRGLTGTGFSKWILRRRLGTVVRVGVKLFSKLLYFSLEYGNSFEELKVKFLPIDFRLVFHD
jgi:hypothetical protein